MINVIFIGFGAVATAVSRMWEDVIRIKIDKCVVIDPRDVTIPIEGAKHIKRALKPDNYRIILKAAAKYLVTVDLIIDLSVYVEAMDMIAWARHNGYPYINTSVEDWPSRKWNGRPETMFDRTIYAKHEKLIKKYGKERFPTIGVELGGQNPGCVSHYVKHALRKLAVKHGIKSTNYAQIARRLGLETIHISEIDTTTTRSRRPKGVFWNTWSCVGFYTEASDPVQLGCGTHEIFTKYEAVKRKYMAFLPVRGMDVRAHSYVPLSMTKGTPIKGYLVPHGEASSITRFLECPDYRPSCYYVYQPCKVAIDSLNEIRENNYIMPEEWKVIGPDEGVKGVDAVGALLLFKNLPSVWIGSILSHSEVKYPAVNATTAQVAANFLSSVHEIIYKSPKKGLTFAEDLDSASILTRAKPYLGKVIMREVPFKPASNTLESLIV